MRDLGDLSRWYVTETSFNVLVAEPYVVRVRAEHVAGGDESKVRASPWSYVSRKVYASCSFSRFLPRGLPQEQTCLPCPEGAVCAGMDMDRIAASQGHYRLPWSYQGLGFITCDRPEFCRGVPTSIGRLATTAQSVSVQLSDAEAMDLARATAPMPEGNNKTEIEAAAQLHAGLFMDWR